MVGMAVELRDFVPTLAIELAAAVIVVLVVAGIIYKYRRWTKVIPSKLFQDASKHIGWGGMIGLFFSELGNRVALQRAVLTDSRVRWVTHFMMFWGFLGLAFATTWVFLFYREGAPRPLSDPGKIVGNIGGALLIIGTTIILLRSLFTQKYQGGRRGDIAFLVMIYLSTITGFTTELARMAGGDILAYANYTVHLIFVIGLLVTAPFTHFLHALLVPFLRYVGRIHDVLLSKGVSSGLDYRKLAMSELSEYVSYGNAPAVYPVWLRPGRKQESAP